jgi:NADPH:quinone reductase-like Zn-dependent oxidoreductase
MLAYVLEADNQAELREVTAPEPGPDEVLVGVRASSVNPHDDHVRAGAARAYMQYDLPAVLGSDVAGEVIATGPGVSRVAVGDRVFGLERSGRIHRGTFAEQAVLPEGSLARTPLHLDDAHAGALGLAALMAVTAIDAAGLESGRSILINGATGGVGCYATQLAAGAGARVLATARPGDEAQLLSECGAAVTIDWTNEDVGAIGAAEGIDVLLDLVNFDPNAIDELAGRALGTGGLALTTITPQSSSRMLLAMSSPDLLDRIARHAERGELKVPLRTSYPLSEIEDAFAALRAGAVGKIGLRVA